jgi:ABC-type glycerol-3-phosphate transport system substrate-binding protein
MNKKRFMIITVILISFLMLIPATILLGKKGGQPEEKTETMKEEKKEEMKPVTLIFWWWGEQEVVGMTDWIEDSIAKFEEKNPHITVEPTLQATDVVLTQFPTAAASGGGPDLLFRWNGIYHLPWVWLGYLEPLENVIPKAQLDTMNVDKVSYYEGKTYSVGWYTYSNVWALNKDLYKKAGLKPDPPVTWDELLANCKVLKDAGILPISLGYKDLFVGEWTLAFTIQQGMDSFQDLADLATGKQSWADYRYWKGWEAYLDLFEKGYLNKDMLSLDISQGMDLFLSGEAAMSMVPTGLIPSMEDLLGDGVADIFPTPIFGEGNWAGKSPIITNGLAISANSKHKKESAEFLTFLHSDERMNALYNDLNAFPANKNFDWSKVNKALDRKIGSTVINAPDPIPWVSELIPPNVMNDIGYGIFQMVFTGELTPEQLGQKAQESMENWKEEDPEMVENYINWLSNIEW